MRVLLQNRRLRYGLAALVLLVGAVLYRPLGGAIAARIMSRKVSARLDLPVRIGRSRAGFGGFTFEKIEIGDADRPLVTVDGLAVPWSAAFARGTIRVDSPRVHVRGGVDELRRLRERLAGRDAPGDRRAAPARRGFPGMAISAGTLRIESTSSAPALFVRVFHGTVEPDRGMNLVLDDVAGTRHGGDKKDQAGFGARRVSIDVALSGLRPSGPPAVAIEDGYIQALPHLGLSGIVGRVWPVAGAPDGRISLLFHGSYGGAKETLWQASGNIRPARTFAEAEGQLSLRAERFSLDKIREILRGRVQNPARATVDASFSVALAAGKIAVKGDFHVFDLDLFAEAIASEPVRGLRFSTSVDATIDVLERTLDVTSIEGKIGDLVGRVSGHARLARTGIPAPAGSPPVSGPGGLGGIDLTLDVPEIACAKLFASFPPAVIPRLQGFQLQGKFSSHLATRIDFSDLESLDLSGSVGIDGCRVLKVPEPVAVLVNPDAVITREVDVPPVFSDVSDTPETLVFGVGPDNPDFVPYESISKHLVNAVLTTEDSRFFKHHGFAAVSEFRKALKRNLAGGGFRLGASSITMQTVKNLLLSHEKTLSRKLQELFLVWYLEQVLSKERILELYLNAIEFGPRIFGIGPAARHYFGKQAADLTASEAAFIANLLPNPKRRYIQYCGGTLSGNWKKLVQRTLGYMHERERLSNDEFAIAQAETVTFDLTARTMTERECRDWVKRITARHDDGRGGDAGSDDGGEAAPE